MTILEVDLLRFETGDRAARDAVVDGVIRSLATGFVYVRHDLSSAFLDTCYAHLERFFRLPDARKARLHRPELRGQRGYTGRLIEIAAGADTPDWKETLNWGEAAPPGHPLGARHPDRYPPPLLPEADCPGITQDLMQFHREMLALQRRFLRIVARGLGAHDDYFEGMTRNGATLTRAAHYPPMAEAPDREHVWADEHGDINLVTILPRATARGLQVRSDDGWVEAVPPEGAAVLNTGMMLEHVSNGRLPTGIHRVVADPDERGDRIAVVQFCHPTPDTILAPLPTCVTPDRPPAFPPVRAADWLDDVLFEIGLGR